MKNIKKKFNITQTDSGRFFTWVSDGCGHNRKKAKITGDSPEEVIIKAKQWLMNRQEESTKAYTVQEAMLDFIESRSRVLEPTTLCNYREIVRNRLQYIMDIKLEELTSKEIQTAINMDALRLSHKSIKNAYGFLKAVLNANDIDIKLSSVRLPKKEVRERKLPTANEVYRIVKGTDSELPVLLAMWLSLRIGEVAGLQFKDVDVLSQCLYIRREIVKADDGWVEIDHCKTEKSVRSVNLPVHIYKLIEAVPHTKETDRILNVTPNTIRKRFKKLLRANGIEGIRFHDCRHIFASTAAMLNVPEKYAMEMGGWSTPDVYKNVYQETFDSERKKADSIIDDFWSKIIEEEC